MGTYATTTSFSTFLVGSVSSSANTALLSSCIDWAEAEVKKKLAKRYKLSDLSATVPAVKTITEQLTIAYFHFHNSKGSKESLQRFQMMVKFPMQNLDDLAAGKFELTDSSGDIISPRTTRPGVMCNTSDYTPTFAEDDPLNWSVDTDKLSDIDSNRD